MSWVITKDHIAEPDQKSRVGVGEGNFFAGEGESTAFKLYDDDGELYYEGRMTVERLNGPEEEAFAPLSFGMYDAGCTRMDYLDPITGEWQTL